MGLETLEPFEVEKGENQDPKLEIFELEIQYKEEMKLLGGQENHIPFQWVLVTQNGVSVLIIFPSWPLMPQEPKEFGLLNWGDKRSLGS